MIEIEVANNDIKHDIQRYITHGNFILFVLRLIFRYETLIPPVGNLKMNEYMGK